MTLTGTSTASTCEVPSKVCAPAGASAAAPAAQARSVRRAGERRREQREEEEDDGARMGRLLQASSAAAAALSQATPQDIAILRGALNRRRAAWRSAARPGWSRPASSRG